MDDELLASFQDQIHIQVHFAIAALEAMDAARADIDYVRPELVIPAEASPEDQAKFRAIHRLNLMTRSRTRLYPFWAAVQALLTAVANIEPCWV